MSILIRKSLLQQVLNVRDSCAVPAASVVAEAVVAWELATALIEQFGLDRMDLIRENIEKHNEYARGF